MKTLINHDHFEIIKHEVLKKSDCEQIIARDCKAIADIIEEKTRCRISETTLKRLFGFAEAKYLPSAYTMDVLAKYCGYKNWSEYSIQAYKAALTPVSGNICIQTLRQRIHHITSCTLQTLKDKSGIAFPNTVGRKFLDEHVHFFLQSDLPGTVLFAPPGSGKTIALCHWVNDFLAERQQHHADGDLLFFVSFNALSNAFFSGKDIHSWLLSMLGYTHDNEFACLLADLKAKDQKFFFVVDGLDSLIIKGDAFKLIMDQIADVFMRYKADEGFKTILTMRTGTLNMFRDTLMADNNWFMGFVNDASNANVPMLNATELKEIAGRINPKIKHDITIEQVRQLQYPLYLQYYCKAVKERFSFAQVDRITLYDQTLQLVRNKICQGNDVSERQVIINAICRHMVLKDQKYYAVKSSIDDVIKHNKIGYHDLLMSGYIVESNAWAAMDTEVRVEFATEDFLCYAVARQLLSISNDNISLQLFGMVHELLALCPWRLKVIKWFILYATKTGQLITADMLIATGLNATEKADLLNFWGDLFRKQGESEACLQQMFASAGQEALINYFVSKEFMGADYHSTLQALLRFELNEQSRLMVHLALGMNAILLLDLPELEKQTALLSNLIAYGEVEMPFDPTVCFNTLYHYLKFGIVKTDGLAMLTKICFNGPVDMIAHPSYQLFYLLGIYTLRLSGNHQKVIRLIDTFDGLFDDRKINYPAYDFFATIARVDALLNIDEEQAVAMHDELAKTHHDLYNEYSALMRMHFAILKLKVMIAQKDEVNIQWQMQVVLNHADQNGYKLLKARCLALLLQNSTGLHLSEDLHKKIYYDLIKLNRECALNNDWFIEGAA